MVGIEISEKSFRLIRLIMDFLLKFYICHIVIVPHSVSKDGGGANYDWGGANYDWRGAKNELGGCAPPRTPPQNPPMGCVYQKTFLLQRSNGRCFYNLVYHSYP